MQNQEISLHDAVRTNNIVRAIDILQRDPSCVNDWNSIAYTALHCLYEDISNFEQADDRLPMLQLLLDHGADVNAQSGGGETPLNDAVTKKQIAGVKLLLENGADPNIPIYGKTSILHCSMSHGEPNEQIIRLLIQHGADLNAFYCDGPTPLDYAMRQTTVHVVQILMEAGAKTNNIYLSLIEACARGKSEIIKLALDHSDTISLSGPFTVESLLHFVLSNDDLYFTRSWMGYLGNGILVIEQLSKLGFDTSASPQEGRTALHIAARNEDERSILALLKAGANVNVKTLNGDTPLHLLLNQRRHDKTTGLNHTIRIVKILLNHGADTRARNQFGHTPFKMALTISDVRIINLMLSKITGLEITKRVTTQLQWNSKNGSHELCVAAKLGYDEIIDRLIDMKYHLQSKQNDFKGTKSPLHYAIETLRFNLVKMLLDADFRADGNFSYNVDLLLSQRYNDGDLRLACLLLENNVISVVKQALLQSYKTTNDIDSFDNKLLHLLVLYYARELHLNRLNNELIRMRGVFKSHTNLSSVLARCNDKIDELKMDKVSDGLSKFDVISMELDSLVKLLNTKLNYDACRNLSSFLESKPELEYDEYMIKTRIDLALEKRETLNSAKDRLNETLRDVLDVLKLESLPDEISLNILGYFNLKELKRFSRLIINLPVNEKIYDASGNETYFDNTYILDKLFL